MITINARKLSDDELKIMWLAFLDIIGELIGPNGEPDDNYKTLYKDVKPTFDFLSKELMFRMRTADPKTPKE
jgi:hypothetical protein